MKQKENLYLRKKKTIEISRPHQKKGNLTKIDTEGMLDRW